MNRQVARRWDASSYDRVAGPMTAMAAAVCDRLELRGDELVIDAGCGTGRVAQLLLERLPRGRLVAVDGDADMVRVATGTLADARAAGRATVVHQDLLELALDEAADAVLSTATFHWIADHDRLFRRLFAALAPGGRLVAQCGGAGNIDTLRRVAVDVSTQVPFAASFAGWSAPWYYAGPEETAARLEAAGFDAVRTWLQAWPVTPEDPETYLSTVVLGAQVQQLPPEHRHDFVAAVLDLLERPTVVEYVRLNIDARRPLA